MTRRTGAIVLSILSVGLLRADQTRDDFALGLTVEPEGQTPLWELRLPDTVYRTVTRQDLGDLRVFNRDGVIVPHAIRRATALLADAPAPQRLSIFPLRGRAGEAASGLRLRIITDERGAVVNAITEDVPADGGERVAAYLVDASALPQMPDRLELDWEGGADGGFAVTVDVESSDDLAQWRTVVSGATLADLRSAEATLVHREINLPSLQAKYLRIEWPETLREVRLSGVEAFFPAQQRPPTRETILVAGSAAGNNPPAYEFDAGGVWPVDQIRVVFQERNAVLQAALLSRAAPDQNWRRRHSGTFYSLERDGTQVQSLPARLESTSDRYWRMEIGSGQKWAGNPPTLEIGWVPDLLTVMAQGEGPFTVAFGSATIDAADRAADGLLRVIDDERGRGLIASARGSEAFTLGGESRLEPPAPPLPWKTWALWTVLLGGVGLLGWMVRQLARRMGPSI